MLFFFIKDGLVYPRDLSKRVIKGGAVTVDVDTVMVDGVILKQGGRMVGLDIGAILDKAQTITTEIWEVLYADRL